MKHNLNQTVAATFAFLGVLCITSGVAMTNMNNNNATDVTNKITKLNVTQKRVAKIKTNEIVVKDIELEVNESLSTNVKDYLKNPNDIENSIIKNLKLDTSNVNITEEGKYTYTITYNKKVYKGNIIVKNKQSSNQVETLTLNELSYEVGTELPKDISSYIKETLTDEIKANIKLDISKVDVTKPGNYQYSINWNSKTFTSNITIYEPKYGTNTVTVDNAKTTNVPVTNNTTEKEQSANNQNTENNAETPTESNQIEQPESQDTGTNENP